MTRGYCTGWRSCQTVKSSADYLSHETSEHPATSARDLSRSLTSAVLISARTISLEMSWGQRNSLMDLLPTTTLQRSASASCLYIPTLPSPTSVLYSLFSLSPSASQPLPSLSSPFAIIGSNMAPTFLCQQAWVARHWSRGGIWLLLTLGIN